MKKTIFLSAIVALFSLPAMATKMTISFTDEGDVPFFYTFDEATKMVSLKGQEESAPYTFDPDTSTFCSTHGGEGEVCVTLDEFSETPAVGDTSTYAISNGKTGIAVITAIEK